MFFRTIYVSGLAEEVQNHHLRDQFGQFGKVNDAHIIYDKLTRKSRGFAFVEFELIEDYQRALSHQTHVINGKQVEIKKCKVSPDTNTTNSGRREAEKVKLDVPKAYSFRVSDRLLKELMKVNESEGCKNGDFLVELKDDSNIFEWNLKLFKVSDFLEVALLVFYLQFDEESQLAKDLKQLKEATNQNYVLFHIVFNQQFP